VYNTLYVSNSILFFTVTPSPVSVLYTQGISWWRGDRLLRNRNFT